MESGGVPAKLTREILSRLPVRSLLRFRIACREWSSIMDEPHFIAAHLDRSKSLPPAITIVDCAGKSYKTIYLDNAGDPTPVSNRLISMGTRMRPTSSVNGILCIPHDDNDGSIELLNPATGESLMAPTSLNSGKEFVYLGFRPDTMEYKIVRLVQDDASSSTQCEVYTVSSNGTGSWRGIGTFQIHPPDRIDGNTCIDGRLYWICQDDATLGCLAITSLDLATEEFSYTVLQNFINPVVNVPNMFFLVQGLLELEGELCVVFWQFDRRDSSRDLISVHLYVLGDDGGLVERASFNIPWKDLSVEPRIIRKGKVYIESYIEKELTGLRMIDLESRNWSVICPHRKSLSFFAHGESLVSLRNL